MRRFIATLATSLLLALPSLADSGLYVGIGAGGLSPSFDLPSGLSADGTAALNGRIGHRNMLGESGWMISKEIQVEGSVGGFDIYVTSLPFLRANVDTITATANVKLETPSLMSMPMLGDTSLFAAAGIGLMHADGRFFHVSAESTEFAGRVGGGVRFGLWGGPLSANVEATHVMAADDLSMFDHTAISGNLVWEF